MLHTDARVQESQVVIDFCDCSDGGTRISRGRFLVNGDGGAQTLNDIHIWFIHLPKKLTGISRKALNVSALPFGINGVKGE